MTNPIANPIVPKLEWSPDCVSCINSSTTTYIIAQKRGRFDDRFTDLFTEKFK